MLVGRRISKNQPKVNEDPKDAMLREFADEIKRLKDLIESGKGPETHSSSKKGEADEFRSPQKKQEG